MLDDDTQEAYLHWRRLAYVFRKHSIRGDFISDS